MKMKNLVLLKGKKRPERSDKRSKNGTHDQRQQVLMEPQKS